MIPNNEHDKCARCQEGEGEVPISDEKGNTYYICEYCDSEMFDNSIESKGLEPRRTTTMFCDGCDEKLTDENVCANCKTLCIDCEERSIQGIDNSELEAKEMTNEI
jgi:uncharacterized CHY-type Zn-finger protein